MKLLIDAFTKDGKHCNRIVAAHIQASKNFTVIYKSGTDKFSDDFFITDKLKRFDVFLGLITLYYEGGHYLEITKHHPSLD